jgi:hypothetical protein
MSNSESMATAQTLFDIGGVWVTVKDGHPRVAEIYKRHYSCYQYADDRRSNRSYRNRNLVMGPGEKMILLSSDWLAIFGWRKFIDDSGQTGVNCAFFRNESVHLSSKLILDAEKLAWNRWPGERLYTYVNAAAVKSKNPGYCFQSAGWRKCGVTKNNKLLIFEKRGNENEQL